MGESAARRWVRQWCELTPLSGDAEHYRKLLEDPFWEPFVILGRGSRLVIGEGVVENLADPDP